MLTQSPTNLSHALSIKSKTTKLNKQTCNTNQLGIAIEIHKQSNPERNHTVQLRVLANRRESA